MYGDWVAVLDAIFVSPDVLEVERRTAVSKYAITFVKDIYMNTSLSTILG